MEIQRSKKLLQSLAVIAGSSTSPSNTCTSNKNIKGGQKEEEEKNTYKKYTARTSLSNKAT